MSLTLTPTSVGTLGGGTAIVYDFAHQGTLLGFYNVTPVTRPSAYTQTFATANKTHAARTYTSPVYISDWALSDSALTAAALDALAADSADTAQLLNSVIDDLQALGLLQ